MAGAGFERLVLGVFKVVHRAEVGRGVADAGSAGVDKLVPSLSKSLSSPVSCTDVSASGSDRFSMLSSLTGEFFGSVMV